MIIILSPSLPLTYAKAERKQKPQDFGGLRGLWRINFKNRSFASLKKAKSVKISSFCSARPFFFKIFLSKSSSWKSYTTVHFQCGKARVCWLMLPEVNLLTGLTKERIWQNYLFPCPGAGAASTPSHFMNCQLMAAGHARQMDWEDVNPLSSGEDSKLQDHGNVHAFRVCSSLQGNLDMSFCSHTKVSNLLISTVPEERDPAFLCSWTSMPSQSPDMLYQAGWI